MWQSGQGRLNHKRMCHRLETRAEVSRSGASPWPAEAAGRLGNWSDPVAPPATAPWGRPRAFPRPFVPFFTPAASADPRSSISCAAGGTERDRCCLRSYCVISSFWELFPTAASQKPKRPGLKGQVILYESFQPTTSSKKNKKKKKANHQTFFSLSLA